MALLDSAELVLRANRYSGSGNWLDESGNGHHATPMNTPSWDGVKFTLAAASSEYFTIPDTGDWADVDDFSVVIVAEWADTPAGNVGLIRKGTTAFGGPGWWLYLTSGAAAIFRAGDGAGGTFLPSVAAAAGAVRVISARRDTDADTATVGVGAVFNPDPDNTVQSLANSGAFEIGRVTDSATYFSGHIYGVAFWQSVLSDAEVAQAGAELVSSPFGSAPKLPLLGVG